MKAATETCNTDTGKDPIFYDVELPLLGTYHPLGFSVEIATNSDQVLLTAEESWGHFRKIMSEPPVQLRVMVLDGGPCPSLVAPTVRASRHLLVRVLDAANFSVSNMEMGFASCWLTRAVAAERRYLDYEFLERMAWDLLDQLYLTPLHAACVRLENKGVLLCGDSGAGKSSLAYACARKGWMFLSDDSNRLIRKCNQPRVVGNPHQSRLRDSAMELFPELRDREITRRGQGKLSIEVPTAAMDGVTTITESSVDYVVFLKRGQAGPPRLMPFPRERALPWFEDVICYREESVREAQRASLRNLLNAEILELHYDDLDSAVAVLEAMVGGETASSARPTLPRQRIHA
jgi:hypothetical protein